jgi:hypothetical protein
VANDDIHDAETPGSSRREFIRRGALLLGIGAWAAPVVQVVRQHRHDGAGDGATAPEEIGVQVITADCPTCVDVCEGVTICGSSGVFDCICAPSADVYPLAACLCAEAGFCEALTPCSAGCPPGFACIQGCCPEPVCLPPCPADAPFAALAAPDAEEGAGRLTVSGKRV